jgi:glucosamine--fructose-6-phosphate aminotransferase (isomerizing)
MCGIFLCSTNDGSASEKVFSGLKKLEYRGYDSWGIAALGEDGKMEIKKYVGKVSVGEVDFKKSNLAMGHTRWATHGVVSKENSHPHISNSKKLIIVHNGIFENFQDYKNILEKENYQFYSETDTEVLVNLIEKEGVKNIFKKIKGGNAFIIISPEKGEVVIAKNGSPLHIGKKGEEIFVSSDRNSILEIAEKIYSLKDKEVISLNDLSKIRFSKVENKYVEASNKQDYKHFTLKEIFDQKDTCKKAYIENKSLEKTIGKNWFKSKSIFVSGCGTAYNAAQVFSQLAAQMQINSRSIPANEMNTVANLLDKNTILFLFSQSGETADSILFAKKVLKAGGKVYSILNSENSTLQQLSTKSFLIHSGKEVAVASTKAFTGMIFTSLKLLNITVPNSDFKILENFLQDSLVEKISKIVKEYLYSRDIFIIGKGLENIISLETALKIKETSYIHAEGFAAGELKHGVLALIEKKVLNIILSTEKKFESDMENASKQIQSRGGELLGIGIESKSYFNHFIKIPNTKKINFVLATVVGQIIAYEFSVQKGLDPDKPRNLAKSVTVV